MINLQQNHMKPIYKRVTFYLKDVIIKKGKNSIGIY